MNWFVVRHLVQGLLRAAVETIQEAIFPQFRPVFIRICESEDDEGGDGEDEFGDEKADYDFWKAPTPCDQDHLAGSLRRILWRVQLFSGPSFL